MFGVLIGERMSGVKVAHIGMARNDRGPAIIKRDFKTEVPDFPRFLLSLFF
jgi:hypothetical protein